MKRILIFAVIILLFFTSTVSAQENNTYSSDASPALVIEDFNVGEKSDEYSWIEKYSNNTSLPDKNPLTVYGEVNSKNNIELYVNNVSDGIISFYDNNKLIAVVGCSETFVFENITSGLHNIHAVYNNTHVAFPSGNNISFNVLEMIVSVDTCNFQGYSLNQFLNTESITCIIRSNIDAVYEVRIKNSTYNVSVLNNTGSLSVQLPEGYYTIDVFYRTDNRTVNVAFKNFRVITMDIIILNEVDFKISSDEINVGDTVNLTCITNLKYSNAYRVSYKFDDGNEIISRISETIKYCPETYGNHTIEATLYSDSFKVVTKVLYVKANPLISNMSVNVNDTEYPNNTTITVNTVLDGNYKLIINKTEYNITVVNNTFRSVINLPVGNYTVELVFGGNEKYLPGSVNASFEVYGININASDVTKYYHGSEKFTVTVTNGRNIPCANVTVHIKINGVTYTRFSDSNGHISLGLNLNPGKYNVTTMVNNTTVNSTVTVKNTINGSDIAKIYKNGTQYWATFKDTNGSYLAKGTNVTFNINGVLYTRPVLDNNGNARLNINLIPQTYIITAINPVNKEKYSNTITVLPSITNNSDLVKYYRNGSQYIVTAVNGDGSVAGENRTVTFNINGVLYERKTNALGQAKLNINLNPGKYVVTAVFNSCSVSNSIMVIPTLTADNLVKAYGSPGDFKAHLVNLKGELLAGVNVTFNINGVFYNRLTDSNGDARLSINLIRGEYIITSSYGGCSVSNSITVY